MTIKELVKNEIEFEREDDGRWIAEVRTLPGVMAYGETPAEARSKVEDLALCVIEARECALIPPHRKIENT